MLPRAVAALVVGVVAVGGAAGPVAAAPSEPPLRGEVIAATARWTASGDRAVTEAVIRDDAGAEHRVSQLGGSADGLAMRQFVGARAVPWLTVGDRVAVTTRGESAARAALVTDVAVERAGPARFVRTGPTEAGASAHWESGCVLLAYGAGGTTALAGDDEVAIMDNVIATWNTSIAGCSYMDLVVTGTLDIEVGRDLVNLIKFRDDRWCRPATAEDAERCYSSAAAGLTTVVYVDDPSSSRDGAIVDADVELNGVDFAISAGGASLGPPGCQADLANTLTHELGHLLGLEHTCLVAGDPPRVDGDGAPVPTCSSTSDPDILDATMYNFQACGEVSKASLSPDDIAGACAIYPAADDPDACEPATLGGGGGCCDARGAGGGGPLLVAVATLAAAPGRRRRRPKPTG
ncbi:MAG: hypothetical protein R2939_08540 [Kofleriaceae bacterium]